MNIVERIKIKDDFSDTPGTRFREAGPNSGQEFLEDILEPKFDNAVKSGGIIEVDIDDTWGYPPSFVSQSFGMLSEKHGAKKVNEHLIIKAEEDLGGKAMIEKIIADPNTKTFR